LSAQLSAGTSGVPGTQLIFNAGNQVRLNADVFTNNAPIEIDAGVGAFWLPHRSARLAPEAEGARKFVRAA
jgi:hypothetical protein